jgi:folate-dependent phosphoribosylglycinamide formyltransferase PurN
MIGSLKGRCEDMENNSETRGKGPRVVALISPDPSDIYFANSLIKHKNVVGVFVERQHQHATIHNQIFALMKQLSTPQTLASKVYESGIRKYYARRARNIALAGFGSECQELYQTANCKIVHTEGIRAINSPGYVEAIKALRPDIIVVCGASLLKTPILNITPHIFNLHSGLSQHYRGVWTTLWAIYNEEPEYVGYTIHFVAKNIDDGDVICQGRPTISETDNHEALYVKVIKLGTEAMLKTIDNSENGYIQRHKLTLEGKLYVRSMVTPYIIKKTWEKVKNGLITEYSKSPKEIELLGDNITKN